MLKKSLFILPFCFAVSACNDRAKMCAELAESEQTGNLPLALEHCKHAAEEGDTNSEVIYASLLIAQDQESEAIPFLEKAANKKNAEAITILAAIAEDNGDINKAISLYKEACSLNSTNACSRLKEIEETLAEEKRQTEKAQIDAEREQTEQKIREQQQIAEEKLRQERAAFEAQKAREEQRLAEERRNLVNQSIQNSLYTGSASERYVDVSQLKFSEGLAVFEDNLGLRGYANGNGEIIIPAQFKGAGGFYNGRAVVKNEQDLWGYIDKTGNWVIAPQYCMAGKFSEGLAGVYIGGYREGDECYGGKWGFITPTGKLAIPAEFDRAWAFSKEKGKEAKAKVSIGDYTGYINGKGEWVD